MPPATGSPLARCSASRRSTAADIECRTAGSTQGNELHAKTAATHVEPGSQASKEVVSTSTSANDARFCRARAARWAPSSNARTRRPRSASGVWPGPCPARSRRSTSPCVDRPAPPGRRRRAPALPQCGTSGPPDRRFGVDLPGHLASACCDAPDRRLSAVDRLPWRTSTDESANGVPSQGASSGAGRADDEVKEETE